MARSRQSAGSSAGRTVRRKGWRVRFGLALCLGGLIGICVAVVLIVPQLNLNVYKPMIEKILARKVGGNVRLAGALDAEAGARLLIRAQDVQAVIPRMHGHMRIKTVEVYVQWWDLLFSDAVVDEIFVRAPTLRLTPPAPKNTALPPQKAVPVVSLQDAPAKAMLSQSGMAKSEPHAVPPATAPEQSTQALPQASLFAELLDHMGHMKAVKLPRIHVQQARVTGLPQGGTLETMSAELWQDAATGDVVVQGVLQNQLMAIYGDLRIIYAQRTFSGTYKALVSAGDQAVPYPLVRAGTLQGRFGFEPDRGTFMEADVQADIGRYPLSMHVQMNRQGVLLDQMSFADQKITGAVQFTPLKESVVSALGYRPLLGVWVEGDLALDTFAMAPEVLQRRVSPILAKVTATVAPNAAPATDRAATPVQADAVTQPPVLPENRARADQAASRDPGASEFLQSLVHMAAILPPPEQFMEGRIGLAIAHVHIPASDTRPEITGALQLEATFLAGEIAVQADSVPFVRGGKLATSLQWRQYRNMDEGVITGRFQVDMPETASIGAFSVQGGVYMGSRAKARLPGVRFRNVKVRQNGTGLFTYNGRITQAPEGLWMLEQDITVPHLRPARTYGIFQPASVGNANIIETTVSSGQRDAARHGDEEKKAAADKSTPAASITTPPVGAVPAGDAPIDPPMLLQTVQHALDTMILMPLPGWQIESLVNIGNISVPWGAVDAMPLGGGQITFVRHDDQSLNISGQTVDFLGTALDIDVALRLRPGVGIYGATIDHAMVRGQLHNLGAYAWLIGGTSTPIPPMTIEWTASGHLNDLSTSLGIEADGAQMAAQLHLQGIAQGQPNGSLFAEFHHYHAGILLQRLYPVFAIPLPDTQASGSVSAKASLTLQDDVWQLDEFSARFGQSLAVAHGTLHWTTLPMAFSGRLDIPYLNLTEIWPSRSASYVPQPEKLTGAMPPKAATHPVPNRSAAPQKAQVSQAETPLSGTALDVAVKIDVLEAFQEVLSNVTARVQKVNTYTVVPPLHATRPATIVPVSQRVNISDIHAEHENGSFTGRMSVDFMAGAQRGNADPGVVLRGVLKSRDVDAARVYAAIAGTSTRILHGGVLDVVANVLGKGQNLLLASRHLDVKGTVKASDLDIRLARKLKSYIPVPKVVRGHFRYKDRILGLSAVKWQAAGVDHRVDGYVDLGNKQLDVAVATMFADNPVLLKVFGAVQAPSLQIKNRK